MISALNFDTHATIVFPLNVEEAAMQISTNGMEGFGAKRVAALELHAMAA